MAKKAKFQNIRPKSRTDGLTAYGAHHNLNRQAAIAQVVSLIGKGGHDSRNPEALSLIELFGLTPEELCEAGIGYEAVMALEQSCIAWRLAR